MNSIEYSEVTPVRTGPPAICVLPFLFIPPLTAFLDYPARSEAFPLATQEAFPKPFFPPLKQQTTSSITHFPLLLRENEESIFPVSNARFLTTTFRAPTPHQHCAAPVFRFFPSGASKVSARSCPLELRHRRGRMPDFVLSTSG